MNHLTLLIKVNIQAALVMYSVTCSAMTTIKQKVHINISLRMVDLVDFLMLYFWGLIGKILEMLIRLLVHLKLHISYWWTQLKPNLQVMIPTIMNSLLLSKIVLLMRVKIFTWKDKLKVLMAIPKKKNIGRKSIFCGKK